MQTLESSSTLLFLSYTPSCRNSCLSYFQNKSRIAGLFSLTLSQIAWIFAKASSSFPVSAHIRFSLVSIQQANKRFYLSLLQGLTELELGVKNHTNSWQTPCRPRYTLFSDLISYYFHPRLLSSIRFLPQCHLSVGPSVATEPKGVVPPTHDVSYSPFMLYFSS